MLPNQFSQIFHGSDKNERAYIFVWGRNILQDSFMQHASMNFVWNIQNLSAAAAVLESWNTFHARLTEYVQSNVCYGDNLFIPQIFSLWPH